MNPLHDPAPPQVHLARAPLTRVICQVKFPPILKVAQEEFIIPFQEDVRKEYPLLSRVQTLKFQFPVPEGGTPLSTPPGAPDYRFDSIDKKWRLTLSSEFLSLEAIDRVYDSRDDFIGRIERALLALTRYMDPTHVVRIGVRYIDRIDEDDLTGVEGFFRREFLGISASPDLLPKASHHLSEAIFSVPEGKLAARWGFLPANVTPDPSSIETKTTNSFILDLDAFNENITEFAIDNVIRNARALSERSYAFFRWSVTDQFIHYFGGNL